MKCKYLQIYLSDYYGAKLCVFYIELSNSTVDLNNYNVERVQFSYEKHFKYIQ